MSGIFGSRARWMGLLLFGGLLACTSAPPQSTGAIEGNVVVVGAPDNQAIVSIPGHSIETGADGTFAFTGVQSGTVAVTAARQGYQLGVTNVKVTSGQTATVSITLSAASSVPTISGLTAVPSQVAPGGTVVLVASAHDDSGSALTYAWTVPTGWTQSGTGQSISLTAPSKYSNNGVVIVAVTNAAGGVATAAANVATTADLGPTIWSASVVPSNPIRGQPATLSATATSSGGLALSYAWVVVTAPAGSSATLSSATAASPTITPDVVGQYHLQVTVTDSAGVAGVPWDLFFTAVNAPPVAVIAGTEPLQGVINTPLTLDATGSTSPDGSALNYNWAIASGPRGASAVVSGTSTATFQADTAGTYVVGVQVCNDSSCAQTSASIVLAGPSTLTALASSGGQSGTVGQPLPNGLTVTLKTATGAPVPGLNILWAINNATIVSGGTRWSCVSDSNGQCTANLNLGRIAGAGKAKAWVQTAPSLTQTFNFTSTADVPNSLAVKIGAGTASANPTVSVRPVDPFGNVNTNVTADNTAAFQLTVSSPSGTAVFSSSVVDGSLANGGGTATINAQLVGGQFDIVLNDSVAENVSVTISESTVSGTSTPLPFTGWVLDFFDNAEPSQTLSTWAASSAGFTPFGVVAGAAQVFAGQQAYGISVGGTEAVAGGATSILRHFNGSAYQFAKLDLESKIHTASAVDSANHCTAQPTFFVTTANCNSIFCNQVPVAPVGGYDVVDACDGNSSFGSSTGSSWVAQEFDLTDASRDGYLYLELEASSNGSSVNPYQTSTWYVDNLVVSELTWPGQFQATARGWIGPGPAVAVQMTSAMDQIEFGICGGIFPDRVTARIVDAQGNATQDSQDAFQFTWTGSAGLSSSIAGQILDLGANEVVIQFVNGTGGFVLADSTAETSNVALVDTRSTGLTMPAGVAAVFVSGACHYNGVGGLVAGANGYWTDFVAASTFNQVQALAACQASYGVGACSSNGFSSYRTSTSGGCNTNYQWNYAANTYTWACGGTRTTTVGSWNRIYWINACSCGAPEAVGTSTVFYDWGTGTWY